MSFAGLRLVGSTKTVHRQRQPSFGIALHHIFIFYMRYCYLLLLCLWACTHTEQASPAEIATLEKATAQALNNSETFYLEIKRLVDANGRKSAHMAVLDLARKLMQLKQQVTERAATGAFPPELAAAFLEQAGQVEAAIKNRQKEFLDARSLKWQVTDRYRQQVQQLAKSHSPLATPMVRLNLLYLQQELMEQLALELASNRP